MVLLDIEVPQRALGRLAAAQPTHGRVGVVELLDKLGELVVQQHRSAELVVQAVDNPDALQQVQLPLVAAETRAAAQVGVQVVASWVVGLEPADSWAPAQLAQAAGLVDAEPWADAP